MPSEALLTSLRLHEGLRLKAYPDPLSALAKTGKGSGEPWTIGYGHCGDVEPGEVWTPARAEAVLVGDALNTEAACYEHLPWWSKLDPVRRDVVAEMAFNLGITGLLGFKNTLAATERGDHAKAADGMLSSLWAKQVGQRAKTLAEQMRTGRRA